MWICLLVWFIKTVHPREPTFFTFQEQPVSQTVSDNSIIQLSCLAKYGQSNIRYNWYRFSKVAMPPTENELLNNFDKTIKIQVRKNDTNLLFQCAAESQGQKIYSNVAKITVDYFEFTGTKVEKMVTVADTLKAVATALSCLHQTVDVYSNKPVTIMWFKGADPVIHMRDSRSWMSPVHTQLQIKVEGSNDITNLIKIRPYDLVFYNIKMTDAGTYFCKAVQDGEKKLLATWYLDVRQEFQEVKYSITKPVVGYLTNNVGVNGKLNNQVFKQGSVTLFCGGIGYCAPHARLEYTWFYGDTVLSKQKQLTITDPMSGPYQCSITCGVVKSEREDVKLSPKDKTTLAVNYTIPPIPYKGYVIGRSLGDIDIPCQINDTTGFRRKYYYNGKEMEMPIKMRDISKLKSGVIQCSFVDILTSTSWTQRTTQLAIIDRPKIERVLPKDSLVGKSTLHVYPGHSVTFSFKVTCPHPVQIQLYTDSVENNCIVNERMSSTPNVRFYNEKCTNATDKTADKTVTVTIDGFTDLNQRVYELRATTVYYLDRGDNIYDKKSYETKSTVQLVLEEPCKSSITESLHVYNVLIHPNVDNCSSSTSLTPPLKVYPYGEPVTLACTGQGYPRPHITFLRNEKPLGQWETSCKSSPGEQKCTLKLERYSQNGVYRCLIHNMIRNQKYYCNTTRQNVDFVGTSVIESVSRKEGSTGEIGVCVVEGNLPPKQGEIYWLDSNRTRVKVADFTIANKYRVISTINITSNGTTTTRPYQCCIQTRDKPSICKNMELKQINLVEDKVALGNWFSENQEKVMIGLIVGGVVILLILLGVCYWCFRRRRRARKEAYKHVSDEHGRTDHVYATAEQISDNKKSANTVAKQPVKGNTNAKVNYAEVEFSPSSKPIIRAKKDEHEPAKYSSVRVRPISDPRYANNI